MNAWNLGLRFGLEVAALGAMGWWGYEQSDSSSRYAAMIGVPLLAAAAWGTFAVEGDPSRSGEALVVVPGVVRLAMELAFFGFSAWALSDIDHRALGIGMGSAVAVHYALSYERIQWLLSQ